MARPHRGGSRTAGARGRQDLGGRGARTRAGTGRGSSRGHAVAQGVHPSAGRRGEQADRGYRGAEEAGSLGNRTRRERRTRLAAAPLTRAGLAEAGLGRAGLAEAGLGRAGLAGAGLGRAGLPGAGRPPGAHLGALGCLRGGASPVAARLAVPGRPIRRLRESGLLAVGGSPGLHPAVGAARVLRAEALGERRGTAPQFLVPRLIVKRLDIARLTGCNGVHGVGVVVAKLTVVHALEPRISRARAGRLRAGVAECLLSAGHRPDLLAT